MQAGTLQKIYDADIGVIAVPQSNISISYIA
jgi:iron complex transport system ATP-binding protein